ncbi:MAG: hypothetical protein IKU19_02525 [Clostridia bacterium]|nr:hypothetical protein [Clostridia bacterium]
MNCPKCGAPLDPFGSCPSCAYKPEPVTEASLPSKFKPMSPWAYFGLNILFSIPVVGFIFLMIFTFNDSNRNRRNYARSYWCSLIIVAIVAVIITVIAVVAGVSYTEIAKQYPIY